MYTWLKKCSQCVAPKKPDVKFYFDNLTKCDSKTNNRQPKTFNDIPGPKSLPIIGTLYKYLPFIGEYSFTNLYETGRKRLKQFGPLVREEIVPNVNVVWVFRPEDIAEIFKAESGLYPERRSHLALLKYRKDRTDIYNTGGLLPTNGPEWWKLRKEFQKVTSKPQDVINYLKETDEVIQEFIELCTNERFEDLLPLLSRLFLELTCLVVFNVRLNSFSKEERCENSTSSKLIKAAFTTNSVILKLDNGLQLWRFFETPLYRKLREAQAYMEMVALKLVSQKRKDTTGHKSFLSAYLENPALDIKDVVGMACDMLLAGIDTTTYSTAFALYHLARHENTQEKLRIEATQFLTNHEPITADVLKSASYTKAVIKESLRLNPISVGIGRILQTDTVLNGYQVPKGTVVVTQNQIICRLPEYFNKPDLFMPERWLREHSKNANKINYGKSIHPYILLPFGHGPRSCIARRFAEQNMQVLLLRICQRLKIFWCGGELGMMSLLINKPDAPLKFNFHEISKSNS
ncbi:hypothetical protein K0M31_012803 [Melipona bicolor]|uniref:Cytochrome P450 302a1, mitochondrial n=1 Tax=Melipona bicolor TaxID=60889 RepID=A0AA40FJP8_9HYME|nr:hypothetical protein K0M31_012803 [Melipona bicolor]